MSPQTMTAAQQRLLLAQAQAVAAAAQQNPAHATNQNQANLSQLPAQLQAMQANINGATQHLQANFMAQSGSASPAQHSPPRSSATPVNAATAAAIANFQQRPPSAQRASAGLPGTSVLPMTNGQVPIARTSNTQYALSYLQNGIAGYTPDQLARLLNMNMNNYQQLVCFIFKLCSLSSADTLVHP